MRGGEGKNKGRKKNSYYRLVLLSFGLARSPNIITAIIRKRARKNADAHRRFLLFLPTHSSTRVYAQARLPIVEVSATATSNAIRSRENRRRRRNRETRRKKERIEHSHAYIEQQCAVVVVVIVMSQFDRNNCLIWTRKMINEHKHSFRERTRHWSEYLMCIYLNMVERFFFVVVFLRYLDFDFFFSFAFFSPSSDYQSSIFLLLMSSSSKCVMDVSR